MQSKEDKIAALRAKHQLSDLAEYKRVYLRRSMDHTERLLHQNFYQLLKELPNGNHYRITGNGKLVAKSDEDDADPGDSSGLRGNVWRGRGSRRGGGWRGRHRPSPRYGLGIPSGSLSVPVSEERDRDASDNQSDRSRSTSPMGSHTSGGQAAAAPTQAPANQDDGTANV